MNGHLHTGLPEAVFAGLAAIVMIHVLRALAGELAKHDATTGAGKVVAAFALAD